MEEKELREKIKNLDDVQLGIFHNQITTYVSHLSGVYAELVSAKNHLKNQNVIFDFEKRFNLLQIKKQESITVSQFILEELDVRVKKNTGFEIEYDIINDIYNDLENLKKKTL